jgi:cobalamin biosynthesis protein CobT
MNWVVNGRIETMISGGGRTCHNVDGEAVEWAGRRLLGRKEQKKVMIVMSDGQPEDSKGSTMLHNHLIYTVKELKKKGVILIGVGIQTTAVRSFYDDYVVLNNVNELPRTLLSKVESKLMQ